MKTVPASVLLISISLFAACSTGREKTLVPIGPVPEYREKNSIFEVIEHENAVEMTEDIPGWVVHYISAGIAGIEALPEYEDRYVFIGKQTGNSLESLKLWAGGFSLDRDFARLVSTRIQARFIGFAGSNPGEEFGRYFEQVIKDSSDAAFNGAVQESDFWIKKRIFDDDGLTPSGETFEYYILISIERELLENQINLLLTSAQSNLAPTRKQSATAIRLRLNFFDGF
jgi:hypothetical protein